MSSEEEREDRSGGGDIGIGDDDGVLYLESVMGALLDMKEDTHDR